LFVADVHQHPVEQGQDRSCAATGIPDCAVSAAIPVVFSATVLPPVRPADHQHAFFSPKG